MNHFIETIKEQPWHKTLGMVLFAIFLVGFVIAWGIAQPLTLGIFVGIIILFWAGNSFFDFVDNWNSRRKTFRYELPEYRKSMHRVIEPSKHKHDGNFYK